MSRSSTCSLQNLVQCLPHSRSNLAAPGMVKKTIALRSRPQAGYRSILLQVSWPSRIGSNVKVWGGDLNVAITNVTRGPETAGQQSSSKGEIITNGLCFCFHDLHCVMRWLSLFNKYRGRGTEQQKVANVNSHTPWLLGADNACFSITWQDLTMTPEGKNKSLRENECLRRYGFQRLG